MARRIYNANVRAYDTLVQTFPACSSPGWRVHGRPLLRARPDRPRRGPAAGGLVRSNVDKYDTSRALPRPRRRPAGPDRGPRRGRRGSPGRRARARPGVRHQPGDRAPGARPVAPGGAGHEPPGRGLVRGRRPGPPAPRSGHDGRGRGRGRRRARRAARSSRSASSTRPPTGRRRAAASTAAPMCCGSSASTSPTTSRSRWSRCGCAADVGADVRRADVERSPFYDLLAAARRRARLRAPDDHRRDRRRRRRRACSRARPAHPLLLCRRVTLRRGRRARARLPSTAIPPTARRSRSSSRCEQERCNMPEPRSDPTTPAESLVEAAYATVPGARSRSRASGSAVR